MKIAKKDNKMRIFLYTFDSLIYDIYLNFWTFLYFVYIDKAYIYASKNLILYTLIKRVYFKNFSLYNVDFLAW